MGLASYGNKQKYAGLHLFEMDEDGQISCKIENDYFNCVPKVEKILNSYENYQFPKPRITN